MPQNKYRVRLKHPYEPVKLNSKHPVKLRYIGSQPYSGFDDNGNTTINCKELEVIAVSKLKAQQLIQDFPTLWIYAGVF